MEKYNIYTLSGLIKESIEDLSTTFHEKQFSFSDAEVFVSGEIYEDYDYCSGDWFTPPSHTLKSRDSDMWSVVVSFNDEHEYEFTGDDLDKLDKLIEE